MRGRPDVPAIFGAGYQGRAGRRECPRAIASTRASLASGCGEGVAALDVKDGFRPCLARRFRRWKGRSATLGETQRETRCTIGGAGDAGLVRTGDASSPNEAPADSARADTYVAITR